MTSFNSVMQTEKLAAIALVIIIAGALSVYLGVTYGEDIFKNLFGEEEEVETIEVGDCVDVHYIGRYASNNTVFDSSYMDVENKTGGTPLQIFVTMNETQLPPEGYETYYSDIIEGLMDGLIGLKEGDTKTVDPIPPEKAYGNYTKLAIGDTFNTTQIALELNQTMEVTNLTNESINLKWINVEDYDNFTMPQQILLEDLTDVYYTLYEPLPPYYIFENASEIINITNDTVVIKTNPTKSENLSDEITTIITEDEIGIIFPDATTAVWNDTTITITGSPEVGKNYFLDFSSEGFDVNITIIIENVTDDHINTSISYLYEGEVQEGYQLFNRTIALNRTISISRVYDVPLMYGEYIFEEDLNKEGYSLNALSGETLLFDVEIVKIYKTSQTES